MIFYLKNSFDLRIVIGYHLSDYKVYHYNDVYSTINLNNFSSHIGSSTKRVIFHKNYKGAVTWSGDIKNK